MSPELQAELNKAIVAAALPSWEWEDGDIVTHSMEWEYGGGCDTCGPGERGMSLRVEVKRAYAPDLDPWRLDESMYQYAYFMDNEIENIWHRVMN